MKQFAVIVDAEKLKTRDLQPPMQEADHFLVEAALQLGAEQLTEDDEDPVYILRESALVEIGRRAAHAERRKQPRSEFHAPTTDHGTFAQPVDRAAAHENKIVADAIAERREEVALSLLQGLSLRYGDERAVQRAYELADAFLTHKP